MWIAQSNPMGPIRIPANRVHTKKRSMLLWNILLVLLCHKEQTQTFFNSLSEKFLSTHPDFWLRYFSKLIGFFGEKHYGNVSKLKCDINKWFQKLAASVYLNGGKIVICLNTKKIRFIFSNNILYRNKPSLVSGWPSYFV